MVKGRFVKQRTIYAALAVLMLTAPAAAQEARALPPYEILTLLHLAKFDPIGQPVRSGPNYVVRATDSSDREVRVVISADAGDIQSVTPVATASRVPPASPEPVKRTAAAPPKPEPLPKPRQEAKVEDALPPPEPIKRIAAVPSKPEPMPKPRPESKVEVALPPPPPEPAKRTAAVPSRPEPLPKPRPDAKVEDALPPPPPEPVKRAAAAPSRPEPLPKPRPDAKVEDALPPPPPEPAKRTAAVPPKPEPLPKPRQDAAIVAVALPPPPQAAESKQRPAPSPEPRPPLRSSTNAPLSLHAGARQPDRDDSASVPPKPVQQAGAAPPRPEPRQDVVVAAVESQPQPTMVAMTSRGNAQGVVVLVNGDPVTNFDIEQRQKLSQLATQKTPSRNEVIEELISEKLKIQMLRRYNIPDVDKDVDNALTNMARRMRQTSAAFTENLSRQGVKIETLKSRMKADIVWTQIIRSRYQSSFQFADSEVQARLQTKKPDEASKVGHEYTLRPILFVVPRGSQPAAYEARVKEAEALRARFQNCEEGIPMARGIRYVAVRPSVIKGSAELPAALRDVLAKTELGRLTGPETTQQGIEVYAVCGKRQSDNAPAKKEIRDEMYSEAFANHAKTLLKELRSQAMIEYR